MDATYFQQVANAISNLQQNISTLSQNANAAAKMARDALAVQGQLKSIADQQKAISAAILSGAPLSGVPASGGNQTGRPDIKYIESIPGRRVPYDLIVKIPVSSTETTPLTGQVVLSTDGPFVAVARYCVFLSAYQFQVQTVSATATFNGRSYGRFRPISSVLDIMDAAGGFTQPIGPASPGTGLTSLVSSNQHSPFRTMEFDGLIEVTTGSDRKRQNEQVPTSLWAQGFNGVSQLPVLDYIERADTVTFKVQPTHAQNPAAGNIQSIVGALPYLTSQYDGHEGIGYTTAVADPTTPDTIVRNADGILYIGYFGFKILESVA